jgi:F-type H+-transporting ATPase subunit b
VGIDWFTFVAQILNFVILVFLLKRFLYRPVLDAVAAREARIREGLEGARQMQEDAAGERTAIREEWADLEARRGAFLEEAEQEAAERRQQLAEDVRVHARKVRDDWQEAIRRQRESFLDELQRHVEGETYALATRVLRDLADTELEDRTIGVFLERVRALPEQERTEFLRAVSEASGRIEVTSAFQIRSDLAAEVEQVVADWTGAEVDLRFRVDPELALGIEMRAGDRKVGWSVNSYLADLRQAIARHLDAANG